MCYRPIYKYQQNLFSMVSIQRHVNAITEAIKNTGKPAIKA